MNLPKNSTIFRDASHFWLRLWLERIEGLYSFKNFTIGFNHGRLVIQLVLSWHLICGVLSFFPFNNKFELLDRSSKVRIVLFNSTVTVSSFEGTQWVISVVSSAYWNVVQSWTSSKSFTYKWNNTEPKMDPCGTPNLVSMSSVVL